MTATTGRWSPERRAVAFLAGDGRDVANASLVHPFIRWTGDDAVAGLSVRGDAAILIDLIVGHVSADVANGAGVWGVIEPRGTFTARAKQRAALEAAGIVPIPVYDPLADGESAFDELARTYDRIAVDGLSRVTADARHRILASLWLRRWQAAPRLSTWLHVINAPIGPELVACPVHSVDTTDWTAGRAWHGVNDYAAMARFSRAATDLPDNIRTAREALVASAFDGAWRALTEDAYR